MHPRPCCRYVRPNPYLQSGLWYKHDVLNDQTRQQVGKICDLRNSNHVVGTPPCQIICEEFTVLRTWGRHTIKNVPRLGLRDSVSMARYSSFGWKRLMQSNRLGTVT